MVANTGFSRYLGGNVYVLGVVSSGAHIMIDRLSRAFLFGAYQLTIALGIILLPIALLIGRLGITLPVHRVVKSLGDALERRQDAA